ncbi:uncharacterized protein LOC123535814 [Mercenaria mercenaria]|uniref:uncharacterized protein LOC123535814 n=1 Tax=Mercenaria mercenaria TaxID=6596 RepID=UPI001E1D41F0|nr:uncharacterized protein LOC123535814 [Mercenaria mercenaria]
MAVSSRDFGGSVSKGSAEDFELSCEPCRAIDQYIDAHAFCADCQEYLCMSCSSYHQRIKATKHHNLSVIDKSDKHTIQSTDSTTCTEKCPSHKSEIIKFFCTNHEFLGCNDCITLNHITCKINYIPDKCAGIGDSDEYRKTMRELDQKLKDMDAVIKKATHQNKEIDFFHDHVIKVIVTFRKEINDRLDKLQKQIQSDAEKKKLKDKQTVKNVLKTCAAVSSDFKKFKSSLQNSKASQQNEHLYIMLKQANSKLKLDDLKNAQESLDKTNIQYTFERNKELETLLTKQDMFGKLNLSATLVSPRKNILFAKLTHIGDINVKTKTDKNECWITGCAILSSNKVILADCNNNKLKVVDTQSKAVIDEQRLDSVPWDIIVLPQDHIAVSVPNKKKILVLTTVGKFSIIHRIQSVECRGITYHQGHLYVCCLDPLSVMKVDTQGKIKNKICLNKEIFDSPYYILVSEDARHIYISNHGNNSVVSVTLQGGVSAEYNHNYLRGPSGMMMLENGSLLVCCCLNGSIHRITGDLKDSHTIFKGLQYPRSICYNQHQQEVYIGGECDQLKILNFE